MHKEPEAGAAVRENVLAVVVAPESSTRLGRVLEAVASGKRKPGRLIVAVTGSDGEHISSVVEAVTSDVPTVVQTVGRQANLGAALERIRSLDEGDEPWIWLLHDDSAPEPDCLDALVRAGAVSRKIGAIGVKQLDWDSGKRLLEFGIRATRSARRVPEIGDDELDQGQYDLRSDVLGIGTAGMLVRRQAGEAVGWFDPALGPFGDGLEFSRRLWAGGWRVVVEPKAAVAHARQSLGYDGRRSFAERRAAQMYNSLVAARGLLMPLALIGYVAGAPIRALARLLAKEPDLAASEMEAVGRLLTMLKALRAARERLRAVRTVPASVYDRLEAKPSEVRRARRNNRRSRLEAESMANDPGPLAAAELARWRASTRRCAVVAILVGLAVGLWANLALVGATMSGGALVGDDWSALDLLRSARQLWLPAGDGLPVPVDALWILLAPLAAFSGLGAAASALIIAAIPVSAATGFYGAGRLTNSPHIRAAAAIGWAAAPPLLAAVSHGHVAGAIWHMLAPVALACVVTAWRKASGPALGCAAIVFAYMSAAAPATLILVAILALAGLATRGGARKRWLYLPVPALVALAPTLVAAASAEAPWRLLAATPGRPTLQSPSAAGLLSLSPTSTVEFLGGGFIGIVSLAAPALLGLAALAALLRRRNAGRIRAGWLGVAAGWAWAAGAALTDTAHVATDAAQQASRGWAGIGLSLACLGLLVTLASAGDGLRTDLSASSFSAKHMAVFALTGAACLAPVALGATWSFVNHRGTPNSYATQMLAEADASPVPAVATASQTSPDRSRVLLLRPVGGGVKASLWRGPGDQLHETSMLAPLASDAADADLASAIASLAGDSSDFSRVAGEHGVSIVLVPAQTEDADTATRTLISQLDAAEGLDYVAKGPSGTFWRVGSEHASSRLRIKTGEEAAALGAGDVTASGRLDASDETRRLVLAERADAGWSARLDGTELKAVSAGWRQTWEVPAGSDGKVTIGYQSWLGVVLATLQAVVAFAAVVVALPRRRGRR
ncbi:MAG: glycosyltransferase [Actinomycetaceae bacterium]|nr:glycosyltransferase [Actinomycetaceae bacterium]